jgi:hypothetical protein
VSIGNSIIPSNRLEEIQEEAAINIKMLSPSSRADNDNSSAEEEHDDDKDLDSDSRRSDWQPEDLDNMDYLNYLHDWNFPIFKFYHESPKNILSQVR